MVLVMTMSNFIKRLIRASTFFSTPASVNDENKWYRQVIKIARETTNHQKKKYNLVTKTSIKESLKLLSL